MPGLPEAGDEEAEEEAAGNEEVEGPREEGNDADDEAGADGNEEGLEEDSPDFDVDAPAEGSLLVDGRGVREGGVREGANARTGAAIERLESLGKRKASPEGLPPAP